MTAEEHPYLLLYWEKLTDLWTDSGIFKTLEEARDEIKAIIEAFDSDVINPNNFVIIPNDGKAQAAFRPLDFGDRIYTGKPKGSMEAVIIERGNGPGTPSGSTEGGQR